jgi:hypothetical protein
MEPTLLEAVRAAPGRTRAARTAHMLYGVRRGGTQGERATAPSYSPGVVDFDSLTVTYRSTMVMRGSSASSDVLWRGQDFYSRDTEEMIWRAAWKPANGMPFGAPLWLLAALCGTRSVTRLGEEEDGDDVLRGLRLEVNCADARDCSDWLLAFPSRPTEVFPAEVWLDSRGRIRRMGCDWPRPAKGPFARLRSTRKQNRLWFITTEFWGFGDDVTVPEV